jgi:hypothetical protein
LGIARGLPLVLVAVTAGVRRQYPAQILQRFGTYVDVVKPIEVGLLALVGTTLLATSYH